jgi:hypothetical protein
LLSSDGIVLSLPSGQGFNAANVVASKTILYFFDSYYYNVRMHSAATGALLGTTTVPKVPYPLYDMTTIRCVSSSGDRMFRMVSQSINSAIGWRNVFALQSINLAAPDDLTSAYIGYGLESKMSCASGYTAWPQRAIWLGQRVNAADGSTVHSVGVLWTCNGVVGQRFYLATHEVAVKPTPSKSPSWMSASPSQAPTIWTPPTAGTPTANYPTQGYGSFYPFAAPTPAPTQAMMWTPTMNQGYTTAPTSSPTQAPSPTGQAPPADQGGMTGSPTAAPTLSPTGMRRTLDQQADATKTKSKSTAQVKAQDKAQVKSESAVDATAAAPAPKKRVASSSFTSSSSSSAAAKQSKKTA